MPRPRGSARADVVLAAFADARAGRRRPTRQRPLVAVAAARGGCRRVRRRRARHAAGRVVDRVREAVGVEHAQPALFSLPAPGGCSSLGRRRSGSSRRTARSGCSAHTARQRWSPFGRFVVATRAQRARSARARRRRPLDARATGRVRSPRWTGTAQRHPDRYLDRTGLRHRRRRRHRRPRRGLRAASAPLAWRPGPTSTRVRLRSAASRVRRADTSKRRLGGPRPGTPGPRTSARMVERRAAAAVLHPALLRVYESAAAHRPGRPSARRRTPTRPSSRARTTSPYPGCRGARRSRARSGDGSGAVQRRRELLRPVTWSPDGRWLLVGSPTPTSGSSCRPEGTPPIAAVANVSAQFRSQAFPRVEGWCCAR